jgi:hypothetical protein
MSPNRCRQCVHHAHMNSREDPTHSHKHGISASDRAVSRGRVAWASRTGICTGREVRSAAQTSPQVRLIIAAGNLRRALLGANHGLKGASQQRMLDAPDMFFENGLAIGVVERRDRLAEFIARPPKKARRGPPPLPAERVNSIRRNQHRQFVLRFPRDLGIACCAPWMKLLPRQRGT